MKDKNILLLNPPFLRGFSRSQRSPGVTKGGTLYYPYWLCYAAGVLEEDGFDVKLIDAVAEEFSLEDVIRYCVDLVPSLVVVNTSTPSIVNDLNICKLIKETLKETFIVLVGTHVSVLTDEILRGNDFVDAIARGEYDYTIRDTARALFKGDDFEHVLGLSFRRKDNIIHNDQRPFIENLNELPLLTKVYRKYLNVRSYYFAAADYPMVMLITGRGCPYGCFFCVYPQTMHGLRYRFCGAEKVIEEFLYVKENLPQVREIVIEDDTFTANRNRCRQICELLIKNKISVKWSANTRADLDIETMRVMRKAGCRLLIAGFESGAQDVLDAMQKRLSLEASYRFMEDARKVGLLVHGCFMMGNPKDTPRTMRETLVFAKRLNPDSAQFYPLFVYPGTKAYGWAKKAGYLETEDYTKWIDKKGAHRCVVGAEGMSPSGLTRFCEKAYYEFYFRPRYILMKLRQLFLNPREGIRSMRGLLNFLFKR